MNIKLGNQALHLTLAKMITLLISMLSGMLLAHFRTLGEYGTYSQLNIVIALATSLFMLGLPNSINYFLARADSKEERVDFLSNYYSLSTLLCVVVGVILIVALPVIESYFKNNSLSSYSFYLLIYPWASITTSSISNVLVVYDRTKLLMKINIITSTVSLSAVIIVQVMKLDFIMYIILFLVGNCIIAVWVYLIVAGIERGLSFRLNYSFIKKVFAFSIPLGLASLVGTISIELDKLVIGGLLNTESVAIYTNAGKELPLTIVASSLTAVLLPQMARLLKNNENQSAVDLWKITIRISYIIICFFVTACIVFAPQIVTLLYSSKYLPGVNVFRIYALVLLFRVTYWGIILNSVGKTKSILLAAIGSLLGNLALNYVFYFLIGFNGPALATLLSLGIVSAIQLKQTSNVVKIGIRRIWPWKDLFRVSTLNAAWGIVIFCLVHCLKLGTGVRDIITSILIGCIVTVVYVLIEKREVVKLWKILNGNSREENSDESDN